MLLSLAKALKVVSQGFLCIVLCSLIYKLLRGNGVVNLIQVYGIKGQHILETPCGPTNRVNFKQSI